MEASQVQVVHRRMEAVGHGQRRARPDAQVGRLPADTPQRYDGQGQRHGLHHEQGLGRREHVGQPGHQHEDERRLDGEHVEAQLADHRGHVLVHEVQRLEVEAEVRTRSEVAVPGQRQKGQHHPQHQGDGPALEPRLPTQDLHVDTAPGRVDPGDDVLARPVDGPTAAGAPVAHHRDS